MKLDELGNWRRTHLSNEVTPKLASKEVIVMGKVGGVRDLGGIKFFVLSDISGSIQITAPKAKTDKKVLAKIDSLTQESAVAVKGKVVDAKQAPRGVEVVPSEIRILNLAITPLPLDPRGRVKANSIKRCSRAVSSASLRLGQSSAPRSTTPHDI